MQGDAEGTEAGHSGGFLDRVYDLDGGADTRAFYAEWAAAYEAEVQANGYATPARCAAALAGCAADRTAPLLDLGCGTGLSGEALAAAGFTTIDGTDFTEAMLAYARAKPGVYRRLIAGDAATPVPAAPGDYVNMAAVGVLSPSHAPAVMIEAAMALLPADGCFVLSLTDHALEDGSYRAAIDRLMANRAATVRFDEYGDHLPGIDLKAAVIVLQRL